MSTSGRLRIALMIAALFAQPSISQVKKPTPIEILVPAYFYPNGKGMADWNELIKAAQRAPIVVILNPANGPGHAVDHNYLKVVSRARAAGARVVGYLATDYAKRPKDSVLHDVLLYRDLYRVDGFFIDEMALVDGDKTDRYYRSVYSFIKLLGEQQLVIGNPGTRPGQGELGRSLGRSLEQSEQHRADALITLENSGNTAYARLESPSHGRLDAGLRDGLLAYEVAAGEPLKQLFSAATRQQMNLIYLTDLRQKPNPWDSLPSYWSELVALVCKHNRHPHCL
jgi:Spherulation-specific family 4